MMPGFWQAQVSLRAVWRSRQNAPMSTAKYDLILREYRTGCRGSRSTSPAEMDSIAAWIQVTSHDVV